MEVLVVYPILSAYSLARIDACAILDNAGTLQTAATVCGAVVRRWCADPVGEAPISPATPIFFCNALDKSFFPKV